MAQVSPGPVPLLEGPFVCASTIVPSRIGQNNAQIKLSKRFLTQLVGADTIQTLIAGAQPVDGQEGRQVAVSSCYIEVMKRGLVLGGVHKVSLCLVMSNQQAYYRRVPPVVKSQMVGSHFLGARLRLLPSSTRAAFSTVSEACDATSDATDFGAPLLSTHCVQLVLEDEEAAAAALFLQLQANPFYPLTQPAQQLQQPHQQVQLVPAQILLQQAAGASQHIPVLSPVPQLGPTFAQQELLLSLPMQETRQPHMMPPARHITPGSSYATTPVSSPLTVGTPSGSPFSLPVNTISPSSSFNAAMGALLIHQLSGGVQDTHHTVSASPPPPASFLQTTISNASAVSQLHSPLSATGSERGSKRRAELDLTTEQQQSGRHSPCTQSPSVSPYTSPHITPYASPPATSLLMMQGASVEQLQQAQMYSQLAQQRVLEVTARLQLAGSSSGSGSPQQHVGVDQHQPTSGLMTVQGAQRSRPSSMQSFATQLMTAGGSGSLSSAPDGTFNHISQGQRRSMIQMQLPDMYGAQRQTNRLQAGVSIGDLRQDSSNGALHGQTSRSERLLCNRDILRSADLSAGAADPRVASVEGWLDRRAGSAPGFPSQPDTHLNTMHAQQRAGGMQHAQSQGQLPIGASGGSGFSWLDTAGPPAPVLAQKEQEAQIALPSPQEEETIRPPTFGEDLVVSEGQWQQQPLMQAPAGTGITSDDITFASSQYDTQLPPAVMGAQSLQFAQLPLQQSPTRRASPHVGDGAGPLSPRLQLPQQPNAGMLRGGVERGALGSGGMDLPLIQLAPAAVKAAGQRGPARWQAHAPTFGDIGALLRPGSSPVPFQAIPLQIVGAQGLQTAGSPAYPPNASQGIAVNLFHDQDPSPLSWSAHAAGAEEGQMQQALEQVDKMDVEFLQACAQAQSKSQPPTVDEWFA